MEVEIKEEFHKIGFMLDNEEEILKKCLTFCINYNLKPSDLVSSWEVYYLNRQLDESTVQNSEMDGFLLHLQTEQKEAVLREEHNLHVYSSKDVDMILNDEEEDLKEVIPGTPTDKTLRLDSEPFDSTVKSNANGYSSGKPSKHVTPFGLRTDKFVVKFNINNLPDTENGDTEHANENLEDDIIKRVHPAKKCSLVFHGSGPEPGCRFMYDRIEDRFNALENRIRRHAAVLSSSGLYEEPMDPTIASQRNVFAVGMICCDGEGHLNEKSILLQSSVEHSGGQCVRLDLHNLSQFSIFPGQLIASGPFTTTDNLLFEPLTELLAYATRKLPQLLILLGPFVDSEHPEIKKGTVDRSFDEIFHMEILRRLQDYVEYSGPEAQVLIVPSTRDAHHDFVFPQPAFEIHPPSLKHQITSLRNPGVFSANQVRVGCCTADILRQLSGEELSRNPKDGTPIDRMSRLASHILSQCSFYPLYPPAEDIPLDFSLASEALHISSIPEILILPSDMKYFIKVLYLSGGSEGEEHMKCICINPGRLAKGEGGGTFVELNYQGSADRMNASVIGI
ncbi:DNA polymerase alpha subunit B isoform X2 [Manihot esculenta]|uniref:DNA polymerase alpha subunit B isoform X2 n=1 Tax=Manihot esculenta TaxID=3983 RepID=UPI001CC75CF3|nr:DNA polymerase alpha subunit B isoform X2 [Manihot esculenta]